MTCKLFIMIFCSFSWTMHYTKINDQIPLKIVWIVDHPLHLFRYTMAIKCRENSEGDVVHGGPGVASYPLYFVDLYAIVFHGIVVGWYVHTLKINWILYYVILLSETNSQYLWTQWVIVGNFVKTKSFFMSYFASVCTTQLAIHWIF